MNCIEYVKSFSVSDYNPLINNHDKTIQLADALFEYETLDLSEVQKVVKGEPIRSVEEKLIEAAQVEERETLGAEVVQEVQGEQDLATVS